MPFFNNFLRFEQIKIILMLKIMEILALSHVILFSISGPQGRPGDGANVVGPMGAPGLPGEFKIYGPIEYFIQTENLLRSAW